MLALTARHMPYQPDPTAAPDAAAAAFSARKATSMGLRYVVPGSGAITTACSKHRQAPLMLQEPNVCCRAEHDVIGGTCCSSGGASCRRAPSIAASTTRGSRCSGGCRVVGCSGRRRCGCGAATPSIVRIIASPVASPIASPAASPVVPAAASVATPKATAPVAPRLKQLTACRKALVCLEQHI